MSREHCFHMKISINKYCDIVICFVLQYKIVFCVIILHFKDRTCLSGVGGGGGGGGVCFPFESKFTCTGKVVKIYSTNQ